MSVVAFITTLKTNFQHVQRGAASHSQGFEDKNLGSSPGWWAATVATYSPSRPGNSPYLSQQNLANDEPPRSVHVESLFQGCYECHNRHSSLFLPNSARGTSMHQTSPPMSPLTALEAKTLDPTLSILPILYLACAYGL